MMCQMHYLVEPITRLSTQGMMQAEQLVDSTAHSSKADVISTEPGRPNVTVVSFGVAHVIGIVALLQVPMDQGANALDMITKFTRNSSIDANIDANIDAPHFQLNIDNAADTLGRRARPADLF